MIAFTLDHSFQLTHPWGCDFLEWGRNYYFRKFQLTHPWGCDTDPQQKRNYRTDFNSHTREGVTCQGRNDLHELHFNSHTREGVTIIFFWWYCAINISTHTPVRVWQTTPKDCIMQFHFNSHTREGVTSRSSCAWPFCGISTHTPVRVWRLLFLLIFEIREFQLTHPWGCDRDSQRVQAW